MLEQPSYVKSVPEDRVKKHWEVGSRRKKCKARMAVKVQERIGY